MAIVNTSLLLASHLLRSRTPSHLLLLFPIVSSLWAWILITLAELLQNLILGCLAVTLRLDCLTVEDSCNLVNTDRRNGAFLRVGDKEFDVEMAV